MMPNLSYIKQKELENKIKEAQSKGECYKKYDTDILDKFKSIDYDKEKMRYCNSNI